MASALSTSLGAKRARINLNDPEVLKILTSQESFFQDLKKRAPRKNQQLARKGPIVDEIEKLIIARGRHHSPHSPKMKLQQGKPCSKKTAREFRQCGLHDAALLQLIDPSLESLVQLEYWHITVLFWWAALRHMKDKTFRDIAVFWRGALMDLCRNPEDFIPRKNKTILVNLGVADRYVPGKRDLSLSGNGINPALIIQHIRIIDVRVAAQCDLMRIFSLRVKESALLALPENYDACDRVVFIERGSKGGRRRIVREPSVSDEDHALILSFIKLVNPRTHCLIPEDKTWAQWQDHMYGVAKRAGLTKHACGCSFHGFRHEGLQCVYSQNAGVEAAIRGGGPVSAEADLRARMHVARNAGHGRINSTVSYCGSGTHRHRTPRSHAIRPDRQTQSHLRGYWFRRRKRRRRSKNQENPYRT
ncbi:MAG: integrase domain-containing protein [Gammaproteobacteria bacterium]|nr:integrase domain-containing protein [Gammaproteobacteria bacterium]